MKTINYDGGLLRFRIPAEWIEEYEDDGGGTFYAHGLDSPTLRLNVLTFESPPSGNAITPDELLRSRKEKTGQDIVRLDTGNAVITYSQPTEEDGEPLVIYYWELANAVPPKHGRLAIFSLTILKSQQSDRELQKTIQMIDREIRDCEFAAGLGV